MPKFVTQVINSPKLMASLLISNTEFVNLTDLINLSFIKINNGVFIKNNSDTNGDVISVKISNVLNTTNTIEIINNDNVFIELDKISELQIKSLSANPILISIIAN
jgi:hypothetical protein